MKIHLFCGESAWGFARMPALEFLTWVGSEKSGRRLNDIVGLTQRGRKDKLISLQWRSCSSRQRRVSLGISSHYCKDSQGQCEL